MQDCNRWTTRPGVELLEPRCLPATANLVTGTLFITGSANRDHLRVVFDEQTNQLVVRSFVQEIGRFDLAAVTNITMTGGGGKDILSVDPAIQVPANIFGQGGNDILRGGGGETLLSGGAENDKLRAGPGKTTFDGDGGRNLLFNVKPGDVVIPGEDDLLCLAIPESTAAPPSSSLLDPAEVEILLKRAAAASGSEDAIIAVVDRNGRIVGVLIEPGVDSAIFASNEALVFAVDGAVAKARTGAFFGNNQAPLTSRTVQFISQTTMTQREIESNPNIADLNSTIRGPGFVAPIGIKGHFPPNVPYTPQVDLFAIEHTNRDTLQNVEPGNTRFNINPGDLAPGVELFAPISFGTASGRLPNAQPRGIATLPGGIPIYENGNLVGGIGVFFPGKTGYANEENSALSVDHNPNKLDRSMEAEYIAFAAVGGAPGLGAGIGAINGVPALPGFALPLAPNARRIDLVGITLDIVGPGGIEGINNLLAFAAQLPGVNQGAFNFPSDFFLTVDTNGNKFLAGKPVSEGWIVPPLNGNGITAAEVQRIIEDGIVQANKTRAAIRLPLNSTTRMVFAVTDLDGKVVGLFRMPDATVFSLDVAVAKARNVTYYASDRLQPQDQLPNTPIGLALTNRSFRYLALPRYPEGIEGAPPGPFSILNDGGVDPNTGLNIGPPLPASAYQSVQGFDAFNPGSNFRDPANKANQNGIIFFPGSEPLYRSELLIGGFGVSGDGVDQDDVITVAGAGLLAAPNGIHIDTRFVNGIRVPYHKYNRNPEGGIT